MPKVRKKNNCNSRARRTISALFRLEGFAVFNIDPEGFQGAISLKNGNEIMRSNNIADAVFNFPHKWAVYISAFCRDANGNVYFKSKEIFLNGFYYTTDLAEVLAPFYKKLVDSCNPKQLFGSGWIANPSGASLDEEKAALLFRNAMVRAEKWKSKQ